MQHSKILSDGTWQYWKCEGIWYARQAGTSTWYDLNINMTKKVVLVATEFLDQKLKTLESKNP